MAKAIDVIGHERILFGTDHVSGKRVRGTAFLKIVADKFRRMPQTARACGASISEKHMQDILGPNGLLQLSSRMAIV